MRYYIIIIIVVILAVLALIIYAFVTRKQRVHDIEHYVTYTRLEKKGQFGNQLFQVASSIGIADKNHKNYKFPKWRYAEYFDSNLPMEEIKTDDIEKEISEEKHWYQEVKLSEKSVVDIDGWRQSEKYFSQIKDKIKNQFKFKGKYIKKVMENFPVLKEGNCISCHVRRGDYITVEKGNYPELSPEYYKMCVDYIRKALADPTAPIIIVSNDINWCKQNLGIIGGNLNYSPFSDEMDDFITLRLCSHHVISSSTFSWWGAWLSQTSNITQNVKIIAPKPWFHPNGQLAEKNSDDFYPPGWATANWQTVKMIDDPAPHMDVAYLQSLCRMTEEEIRETDKYVDPDFGRNIVINMDARPDKWENAKSIIGGMGMTAIRFPAIEGAKVPEHEIFSRKIIDPNIYYIGGRHGVFGCLLSHMVIYAIALKYGWKKITIFEDDIGPAKGQKLEEIVAKVRDGIHLAAGIEQFDKNLNSERSGADILYLGKCHDSCGDHKETKMKNFVKNHFALCAHAYHMTLPAMRKMLNLPEYGVPIDLVLGSATAHMLTSYAFHPSLIVQNNDFSSDLRDKSQQGANSIECS